MSNVNEKLQALKVKEQEAIDYCNTKLSAKGVTEQATSVVDIGNKIESIQSISSGVMNNLTFDFSGSDISVKRIRKLFENIPTLQSITFTDVVINRNNFLKYTLLDYIQSTGTQYINTGVYPTADTVVEVKFQNSTADYWERVYGLPLDAGDGKFELKNNSTNLNFYQIDNNGAVTNVSISANEQPVTVKVSDGIAYVNNTEIAAPKTTYVSTTYPIQLFYGCGAYSYISLYGFKVWQGGKLVRDMVPVLDTTGTACMYDTITKKYYYNKGTEEFITGPLVIDSNEINNGVIEVNLSQGSISNKTINDLFATYQEVKQINFNDAQLTREEFYNYTGVEYIESTGTQWIDTDIIPINHEVIATYQYTKVIKDDAIFGANAPSGADCYHLTWYDNKWYYACGGNETTTIDVNKNFVCTNKQTVDFNNSNNAIVWNDENNNTYSATANINGTTTATQRLKIFDRANISSLSSAKLYSFEIIDKETQQVVRNFIPVRDTSDIPCLYDTITKKYYYNQGTGEFLYGEVIN